MQDPNEDTEWNDVLRSKGILPPKQQEAAITEDTLVQVPVQHSHTHTPPYPQTNQMVEETVQEKATEGGGKALEDMTLEELEEMEDEEDERILLQYR